jgi:hypothetical protein
MFSLVILFTLTLTTIFGSRVSLLNEKMSANDFRAKESMLAAEAGLDEMARAISNDFLLLCTTGTCKTTDATYPLSGTIANYVDTVSGSGTYTDSSGVIRSWSATAKVTDGDDPTDDNDPVVIKIVSTGTVKGSAAGAVAESTSVVTQLLAKTTLLGPRPASPLTLTGTIKPVGGMSIVGNPNAVQLSCPTTLLGKTTKCPGTVSVWSPDTVDAGGAFTTCSIDTFIWNHPDPDPLYSKSLCDRSYARCDCADMRMGLSGKWPAPTAQFIIDTLGPDIVAPPVTTVTPGVNFPPDLFTYVFGASATPASVEAAANAKARVLANCSTLGATSSGTYWINGDCTIPSTLGSVTKPVLLVIKNGKLKMSGSGDQAFGMAYVFGAASGIQVTGGIWYGGIIDDSATGPAAGGFALVYSDTVFDALRDNADFAVISAVPGTWRDWN